MVCEGLSEGVVEDLLPSNLPVTGKEFKTRAQRGGGFYRTAESRHGEEGFPAIRALHL